MVENNLNEKELVDNKENDREVLEKVLSVALQTKGVKIDRNTFLTSQFKNEPKEILDKILEEGPVKAGISQDIILKQAKKIAHEEVIKSTTASFAAGLPGGLAMAAAIPADILQFYAIVLRLAQEVAYLYGEEDLNKNGNIDDEKIKSQLLLYLGAMFGVTGAGQLIRIISSSLASQVMHQLPKKALTKTFYYPIIKNIAKFLGMSLNKDIFGKGVGKAIPVVGGIISGGFTYATMKPMTNKLIETFNEAKFNYNEEAFQRDLSDLIKECGNIKEEKSSTEENIIEEDIIDTNVVETSENQPTNETNSNMISNNSIVDEIKKYKELLDNNIITQEEFQKIKDKLIERI